MQRFVEFLFFFLLIIPPPPLLEMPWILCFVYKLFRIFGVWKKFFDLFCSLLVCVTIWTHTMALHRVKSLCTVHVYRYHLSLARQLANYFNSCPYSVWWIWLITSKSDSTTSKYRDRCIAVNWCVNLYLYKCMCDKYLATTAKKGWNECTCISPSSWWSSAHMNEMD